MTILITVITFFIIFSILILVHELGHFFAARKAGIRVEEFGFGLPPRAFGKEVEHTVIYTDKKGKKKTEKEKMIWSLNWIPFGGFVKMLGEDDTSKAAATDPRAFGNRPLLLRIMVVVAGVAMNFLLGWLLLTIVFTVGSTPLILDRPADIYRNIENGVIETAPGVYVSAIKKDSLAAEKGLKDDDIIFAVDQTKVNSLAELEAAIKKGAKGAGIHFSVNRENADGNEENLVLIFTPESAAEIGLFSPFPPIKKVNEIKLPVHKAALYAGKESVRLAGLTVKMFGKIIGNLVTKLKPPARDEVAGPVGIAKMTHEFVVIGELIPILVFMALISISLAVINIMPLPALDGGRLLFLLFELITRKKANAKWEATIHAVGFALLFGLIALVTYGDIMRWIES